MGLSRTPRSAARLGVAVLLSLTAWHVDPVQAAPTMVTDVTLVETPAELQVAVVASGPVTSRLVDLNPNWIVLDVPDAKLATSWVTRPLLHGIIQGVRVSQHLPGVVRVIVQLSQPAHYHVSASPDRHTMVIGLPTDAGNDPPPPQRAQVTPTSPPSSQLIDLKVRDMEIVDVLSALAKLAHLNIVTDAAVRGRITVQLTGVTVEQALRLILEPNGLGFTMVGNNLIVGTRPILRRYQLANFMAKDFVANILPVTGIRKEQVSVDDANNAIFVNAPAGDQARLQDLISQVDVPSELATTRVIRLNYVDAALFLDLLGARLPDTVTKTAKVDKAGNSVVLTATAAQMALVDSLLGQVDNALPQVLIEASIAEVPTEVIKTLGFAWQTATTFTVSSTGTNSTTGQFSIGVTAPAITTILNTLVQENKARLLANPRLAVRDGETARMTVGDKIPFQIINPVGVASLVILDAGVRLEVTPRVNRDGYLTVKMHPEVSAIATAAAPGVPPTISTREADSSLTVKDGTSIILAGLIQKNETRTTVKVPLLGDIPILGFLFKSESTDVRDTEVVFIITPHILAKIQ
ncbi:MAG TPA: secretin N-terminal domain-containing protein [bacterium]|nr:secretin N-terminal domain-containing protein [bacterium]